MDELATFSRKVKRIDDLVHTHLGANISLNYSVFRDIPFENITLHPKEYELALKNQDALNELQDLLGQIVEYVSPSAAGLLPFEPGKSSFGEQALVAAKITFKRALYLILLNRFCDAALTAMYACDFMRDAESVHPREAAIRKARFMFNMLLEETFGVYADPTGYTASDCRSNCGYCQDPLSTVAKYCSDAFELLGADEDLVTELWTRAAAMLAAYCQERGGDLENMRFPESVPRKASNALRLILMANQAKKDDVVTRARYHAGRLKVCELDTCDLAPLPW